MCIIGSFSSCIRIKDIEFHALKPATINIGEDFNNIKIFCKHNSLKVLSKYIFTG
jgi:hypothetical protein